MKAVKKSQNIKIFFKLYVLPIKRTTDSKNLIGFFSDVNDDYCVCFLPIKTKFLICLALKNKKITITRQKFLSAQLNKIASFYKNTRLSDLNTK